MGKNLQEEKFIGGFIDKDGEVYLNANDLIDFFEKEYKEIACHEADKKAGDLMIYLIDVMKTFYQEQKA